MSVSLQRCSIVPTGLRFLNVLCPRTEVLGYRSIAPPGLGPTLFVALSSFSPSMAAHRAVLQLRMTVGKIFASLKRHQPRQILEPHDRLILPLDHHDVIAIEPAQSCHLRAANRTVA